MNQSPSCNLHESSLPDGFLHSSLKKLVSTRALLSFEGRFVKFRWRMGYTYRAGKVQVQEKSSCFRELPSHCICWLQGWEMTGSQVRALKSTDEHPDGGHPRQAASATCLGSNDSQHLGGVWRGAQQEPPKDCKGTKEPAWAQHCQTQIDHFPEAEHPPGGEDGQTTSSRQEISECYFGVGWVKYTSASGVTEQPVHTWDPNRSKAATRSGIVGMTTETQTLCEPCVLLQFKKLFGFSKCTKDSHTWKKLGSVPRNLHISVKFSKSKISARSFQVRKISLRTQVNDKRQMPGKTHRLPTLHTCHWQGSVTSSWERTALVRLKRNGDLGATSSMRSSWMCYFWGLALLWAMGCSARHTPFPDVGRTKQTARA